MADIGITCGSKKNSVEESFKQNEMSKSACQDFASQITKEIKFNLFPTMLHLHNSVTRYRNKADTQHEIIFIIEFKPQCFHILLIYYSQFMAMNCKVD